MVGQLPVRPARSQGGWKQSMFLILHPLQRATKRPTILVHIPAGTNVLPLGRSREREEIILSLLSNTFPSATLISINYRLGTPFGTSSAAAAEDFRFPQPVHDSSVASAHIIDEIVPSLFYNPQGPSATREEYPEPRVTLIGSHIGAALATLLALTNPNQIHSVAVANPLVDWVILDELLRQPQTHLGTLRVKRTPPSTAAEDPMTIAAAGKQLIDLRTRLFASPSAYFDPFASPTLFLRAPGRDTPRTHAEALGMLDDELSYDEEAEGEGGWGSLKGADDYSHVPSGEGSEANGTDDWDAKMFRRRGAEGTEGTMRKKDLDTITEAIGADSFGPYDDDHPPNTNASSPSSLERSTQSSAPAPPVSKHRRVKRRKVLRRWPPLSRPEDVMLPYFNVFVPHSSLSEAKALERIDSGSTAAPLDALLRLQGIELVDLLRRACFYGREKGFGEEKVVLTEFRGGVHGRLDEDEQTRTMLSWLAQRLEV